MLLILSPRCKPGSPKKTLEMISAYLAKNRTKSEIAYFEDISITLEKGAISIYINNKNITVYDSIYFRQIGRFKDLAFILSLYSKKNNIKFIDAFHINTPSQSKLIQCVLFTFNNIQFPKTYFSQKYTIKRITEAITYLKFPIIIKELETSQGAGVFLAKTKAVLCKKLHALEKNNKQFILQEFINNNFEYRILVLGGTPMVSETKTRQKNEFRNNVSLGATEKFILLSEVPKKVLNLAKKSALTTKIDVAGVDILQSKNANLVYVLEVNSAPQFTLDEKTSTEISALSNFLSQ